MKLFSKRSDRHSDRYVLAVRDRYPQGYAGNNRTEFIGQKARTRLVSLVRFLTSSDHYLEKYILIDDKKNQVHYFNNILLDNFSEAELGYKFSYYFKFDPFIFKKTEFERVNDDSIERYDDFILFDLLETTILFSKIDIRPNVIERINEILIEEKTNYCISKNLISRVGGEDLKSITPQLKDIKLKQKINSYFDFYSRDEFVNSAKISADILNIIFSDEKKNKKSTIKSLTEEISQLIVNNPSEKHKRSLEFTEILNNHLAQSNTLNNQIYDIRHSEKDRISISNVFLYKLVSVNNISLIEFVLTCLKDEYIVSEDWESIKDLYIERYKINKNSFWFVPAPDVADEINPEDIPF